MRATFLVFAFVLISISNIQADTINIPADYPTIQKGIDAAVNGDTVLVAPGTYVENIDFKGKAITVMSKCGAFVTTIDGNQENSVVRFDTKETNDSILKGFTVTNGLGILWPYGAFTRCGGGIYCGMETCAVIDSNIITGNCVIHNDAIAAGGGIACDWESAPLIVNNLIFDNRCSAIGQRMGGGICCFGNCCAIISNNLIFRNDVGPREAACSLVKHSSRDIADISDLGYAGDRFGDGIGGGICCGVDNHILLKNNTVCYNTAENCGGGLYCIDNSPVGINTIFWMNQATYSPEIYNNPDITYSCIQGGYPGQGNIDTDPVFIDPANDDFHLTYDSPCRDTGDNSAVTELCDFEGDPRIAWGGIVDMGADEFYTHLYVTGDQTPGGDIQGQLVGLPGTSPVGLFIGSGIRPEPAPTPYGDFWLLPPKILIPLIPIPANGILSIPTTISLTPPAPYDIPMQGLVGLNSDSLTNLCMLEVR